jgi:LTXXQ motif family protein
MPRMTLPPVSSPHLGVSSAVSPAMAATGRAFPPNLGPSLGSGPGQAPGVGTAAVQTLVRGRSGGPVLRNPAFATASARDPANSALAQSTFAGRFAHSAFFHAGDRHRHRWFPVIGFVGPLFWPFAYDDFFDYTFAPYAYDTFWPYAYDEVFDGIYGPIAAGNPVLTPGPEPTVGRTAYVYGDETGAWISPAAHAAEAAPVAGSNAPICSGQTGALPVAIERLAQFLGPNQEQQVLLDGLKGANMEALNILQAACPSDLPSTPPGRLAAMRIRVEAMLAAARTIEPALLNFYRSLSDEQKQRLNVLDAATRGTEQPQPDPTQLCGAGPQITRLPIADVGRMLRLGDAQNTGLNELDDALNQAREILKSNCPNEPTLTPTARLSQVERRLEAVLQMLDKVQPALMNFYGSLDDEQKAGFNRLSLRAP